MYIFRPLLITLTLGTFLLNATGNTLNNQLFAAVENNDLITVHKLLKQGADANAFSESGHTSLMFAGSRDIAEALLRHGADINIQNAYGKTALMYATISGCLEVVVILVEHDADVQITDLSVEQGKTALTYAQEYGHTKIAEFLKAHGAVEQLFWNL